jgi:hypothetical protein
MQDRLPQPLQPEDQQQPADDQPQPTERRAISGDGDGGGIVRGYDDLTAVWAYHPGE